ncbi:EamA family transporter [Agilicoccus flavus]|uniref:EamA family transporter n=1 Tax=Agilicoccus flavus TaxID=2775968 RepID=UPI001CF69802|nr:EamA family transporter [Agilicoccus flavus]
MNDDSTSRRAGITALVAGGASQYVGAALAVTLFPLLGPAGVTLARQLVLLVVHGGLALRRPVRPTPRQLFLAAVFGVVLTSMNLAIYAAIDRIGLGTAVTLEFVGPIAVAVLGHRTRRTAVCSAVTALGVVALARPTATTDWLGVALALWAAASWAAYIYANRAVGRSLPGFTGSALAALTSVVLIAPVALPRLDSSLVTPGVVGLAIVVGVLTSAVPYALDTFSLRRLDASLYASLLGLYPVLACVAGVVLLGESVGPVEVVATASIVASNAVVVRSRGGSRCSGQRASCGRVARAHARGHE